jgi:cycloartenol synthase
MWRFVSAGSGGPGPANSDHPLLHSLNDNVGRQTWEFDPEAGTPAERAEVERLRKHYTDNRFSQKHSSDELLRLQCRGKIDSKAFAKPGGEVPEKLDAKRVEDHLKGAISFYECLQQDDGHWPGDYGGPMFLFPGRTMPCVLHGACACVCPSDTLPAS